MFIGNDIYEIQPNKQLESYQIRGIIGGNEFGNPKSIYSLIREGKKNILAVSPGGSGKTVIMSKVAFDFISKSTMDVAIFVHRKELLNHARIEINDWYGIYSQKIDSTTKIINPNCRIFVCMIETFDRRSVESFLKYFSNVGLYMIDECHLQSFNKIFCHFPNSIRIGFTATPISADKKRPLLLDYDDIVIIATINELIELNKKKPSRGIVTCYQHDYEIDIGVDYKGLKVNRNGEFDESYMGEKFSGKTQIKNTIAAYEEHSKNKKCIIFNANIEHSLKMHEAMLYYGFNSQHIDSDTKSKYSSKQYREFIFGDGSENNKGWLTNTENGVLNNVGIATIGTDVKSILTVIVNHSTKSFTKFWQMAFRGNRAFVFPNGMPKEYFTLISTGNNMLPEGNNHGVYWDEANFDWDYIYRNPKQVSKKVGVSPIKSCPECGAINSSQARICVGKKINQLFDEEEECGYLFIFESENKQEDEVERKLILVSELINSTINVKNTIEFLSVQGRKEASGFYETVKQCCALYKKNNQEESILLKEQVLYISNICYGKVSEWFKLLNKRKWNHLKIIVLKETIVQLEKLYYIVDKEEFQELKQDTSNEII